MNSYDCCKKERDQILSMASELECMEKHEMHVLSQKIMKAMAVNGSVMLQFLNLAYCQLTEIRTDIDKNDKENAKRKLDTLSHEILEFRHKI